jgi:hypothetical protein
MARFDTAPCPVCGAPINVPREATHVVCAYCRADSAIRRAKNAKEAAEMASSGGPPVIVIVSSGLQLARMTLLALGGIVLLFFAGMFGNFLSDLRGASWKKEALWITDLHKLPDPLENHLLVTMTRGGRAVIASSSGRLRFLDPQGNPGPVVALPVPRPRALLGGLTAAAAGGVHVSFGGAIFTLDEEGRLQGAPLPSAPDRQIYGAIGTDRQGRLLALTRQGTFVRLDDARLPAETFPMDLSPVKFTLSDDSLVSCTHVVFDRDGRAVVNNLADDSLLLLDPLARRATPVPRLWKGNLESGKGFLDDGTLLLEAGRKVWRLPPEAVRGQPGARASEVPLQRPGWLRFNAIAGVGNDQFIALDGGSAMRFRLRTR